MTTLLTCRHTYEQTLLDELQRAGMASGDDLLPGLVRVPVDVAAPPAYALQVLPHAELWHAPSIRALAQPLVARLKTALDGQTGTWDVHALVPGQLKGTPKPLLRRRADLVRDAVLEELKTTARWAMKRHQPGGRSLQTLGQFVLLDETHLWHSVAPVQPLMLGATWPATLPAGLADVADDDVAPASSYRKLVEALACLNVAPQPGDVCVDLGACPGGWTRVLLTHGAKVYAVDRAPLAPHLMADRRVSYVAGDAFAWRPPEPVTWLVSDIVAFPERVRELLATWLAPRLCRHFVVQMKFKGEPDWSALAAAQDVVAAAGYQLITRHFFNDKNELTLMGTLGG